MAAEPDFFGVCSGFAYNELADLDGKLKQKLLTLMARIMEQCYRRGFQHGEGNLHPVTVDIDDWRFLKPLDTAISPFGHSSTTAIERLLMEVSALREIGLAPKRGAA